MATERTAAGRQNNAFELFAAAGLQALENRAVLAIDRQDGRTSAGSQLHNQRTGHDERLFISDGDAATLRNGSPGASQAGTSDDGSQNNVNRIVGVECRMSICTRACTRL